VKAAAWGQLWGHDAIFELKNVIPYQYLVVIMWFPPLHQLPFQLDPNILSRFETDTRFRDFKAFHFEQAIAFKKHLAEQHGKASGEKPSKATLHATLAHLKRFFQ
jgi:hypothetical protein